MKILFSLCVSAMLMTTASAQLLEYRFNETGTTAASSGSLNDALTLYNQLNAVADQHSDAGGGLTGQPSDRSFDNSEATGMGVGQTGGGAKVATTAFDNLTSFTVQGWFNASVNSGGAARLFEKFQSGSASTHYLSLQLSYNITGDGSLSMRIGPGANTATTSYSSLLGRTQEWIFFAVTFDSTKSSDNLHFYAGSSAETVLSIGSATLDPSRLPLSNSGNLVFGNANDLTRPFAGYMDNLRIYGSTVDGSGALTLEALEGLRTADAVPEPQTAYLLIGGTALGLGRWFFKRRNAAL